MKKFKQILGLIIIISLLARCNSDKGFTIKGHIDGIEDGTLVTLYDLDQQFNIDSAYSENGNFIFKGKVEYPTTCRIICKEEKAVIQVENLGMTFNAPIKDMNFKSSIKGGQEQELQNELNLLINPYLIEYLNLFDSLWNKKYSNDFEKQRLIKKYNDAGVKVDENNVKFGKSHTESYLGLSLIYGYRKTIPKDTLILIYEKLSPKFKEIPTTKDLKIFLYEDLAQKGKSFIDFKAKTLKGEDFLLSSLNGNYIYLSFWSAGCGPCRMENRFLSQNFSRIPKNLSLVNFSMDKNSKVWKAASLEDSIIWHNVTGLETEYGRVDALYQVSAMPTSFLIGPDGIIIEKFTGYDLDHDLITKLGTLLSKE